MANSDATPEEDQPPTRVVPPAGEPWWRPWLGPGVAATIISALLIALVTVGVAGFNPLKADNRNLGIMLKGDMRDLGVMVGQQIEMVRLDNMATETRLREDMKDFRIEVKGGIKDFKEEIKEDLADLKADNQALSDKLDRVLESSVAART